MIVSLVNPAAYLSMSYPGYIGKEKEYEWVEYLWVLSRFGNNKKGARKRYRDYTEEALSREVDNPVKTLHDHVILGREEFIYKIKRLLKGKALSHES